MSRFFSLLTVFAIVAGVAATSQAASYVNTSSHKEDNFNGNSSNDLGPFELRNTTNGNYVKVISNRLKCKWYESNYAGNRNTRSAEIWSTMRKTGAYFVGFRMRFPGTSGGERFPNNKQTIVHQNMQRLSNGSSSWFATIKVDNNKLIWEYRTYNGGPITEITLDSSLNRNSDYKVITRIRPGNSGRMQLWLSGNKKVDVSTKTGFDSSLTRTQKWGMYCYDSSNYSNNEVRTMYLDNVAAKYTNANSGYNDVNPN